MCHERGRSGHQVVNGAGCGRRGPGRCGGVGRVLERLGAGARGMGLDETPDPLTVHGLIYVRSIVMLDSARRAGARTGAVAARLGDYCDAGCECRTRLGARHHRRRCGRVADGRARRIVRAPDDDHSRRTEPEGAPRPRDDASVIEPLGQQAAVVFATPAFPKFVPSVRRCMLASRAGSGCASTLLQLSVRMAEIWPHSGARGTRHKRRAMTPSLLANQRIC